MDFLEILGVKISVIDQINASKQVEAFLQSPYQHIIFTPNPEFLVKAQSDEYFRRVLNNAQLNICDGMGLYLASNRKLNRITGVDFTITICQLAAKHNKSVFLLGAKDVVAQKAAQNLTQKINNLKIAGFDCGLKIKEKNNQIEFDKVANQKLIEKINFSGAEILLVAFGMSKQEKWIYENLSALPQIKVAMGVGGTFDFISGYTARAPIFLRKIGLEWLYRLYQQPQRIKRIFNATVVFMWLVIKSKLKSLK